MYVDLKSFFLNMTVDSGSSSSRRPSTRESTLKKFCKDWKVVKSFQEKGSIKVQMWLDLGKQDGVFI
jgi:hypothetical protein